MPAAQKQGTKKDARIGCHPAARIAAGLVSLAPMYPAAESNLQATAARGLGGAILGVSLVALAAVAIHMLLHSRCFVRGLLYGVLAVVFLAGSSLNAIKNVSASGEDRREDISSQNLEIKRAGEDRERSSQARKAQFEIAGDATVESIEAEIHAKQVEPGSRWNVTAGCDAAKVTAGPSRTFCAEVDRLKGKLAAARKRDELDARIAKLDASDTGKGVQKTVDAGAERIAGFLRALGYKVEGDEGQKQIIVAGEWVQVVLQEMIAGFGPGLLFAFLMLMLSPAEPKTVLEAAQKPAEKPVKEKPATIIAEPETQPQQPAMAVMEEDAEIDRFIAACLEFVQGEFVAAAPLFTAWNEFCAGHKIEPGSPKGFSNRIKRRVQHQPNNGRPRYVGVRLRSAKVGQAGLRLVVNA